MTGAVRGAMTNNTAEAMPMTATARVTTDCPKASARCCASSVSSCRRPRKIGTKGAVNPLAMSTSSVSSGRTNAAL